MSRSFFMPARGNTADGRSAEQASRGLRVPRSGTGSSARTVRPLVLATAIAVVLLSAIAPPAGALTFSSAPGSPITVGSHPRPLAVGDFNRDGLPDLVSGNPGNTSNGTLSVLLGDGSGGFRQARGSPIGPIKDPISIAVGDFNGDGRQDLAVANGGVGTVTVLLGNGSGGFSQAPGSPVTVGGDPGSVAVGDFNGDRKQDLAVTDLVNNQVVVLLGDGSGGFAPAPGSPVPVGPEPADVVVGDFNRDGKQDLATANIGDQNANGISVSVLLGDGAGGFTEAPGSPITGPINLGSLAVGDFNDDGNQDLAVPSGNQGGRVYVFFGDGSGRFSPQVVANHDWGSVAVGDLNGDHQQDLVGTGENGVSALIGNGHGQFRDALGSPYATALNDDSVVVADFNRDGRADLAMTGEPHDLTVLLNNGTRAAVSPQALAFRARREGARTRARSVTLTRSDSDYPLRVSAVRVRGPAAADFRIGSDSCAGRTLDGQPSCTIKVYFRASRPGRRTATLVVADDAPGSPQLVSLSGAIRASGRRHPRLRCTIHHANSSSHQVHGPDRIRAVCKVSSRQPVRRAHWRLVRGKQTVAHGRASIHHRRLSIRLAPRQGIRPGSYTLSVTVGSSTARKTVQIG